MGKIDADIRTPLLKFNAIRNEFAHGLGAKLTEKHARDFYNVFDAPKVRYVVNYEYDYFSNPLDAMRYLVRVLFVTMTWTLERMRDEKLWNIALHEEVVATLEGSSTRRSDDPHRLKVNARISERFERLRRERESPANPGADLERTGRSEA